MNTTPSNTTTNNKRTTKKIKRSIIPEIAVMADSDGPIFQSMSIAPPPPRFFHQEQASPLQKTQPSALAAPPRDPNRPWSWKIPLLLPVPMFHPLERTAAKIENLALDSVTSRISNFMKSHSITCQYHSDQGFVDCMTDSQLQFVVQLWQQGNNMIIMEVQRRQGCCIAMQTLRHQLLAVVVNGESSRPAEPQSRSTCAFLATLLDQTSLPPPPQGECLPTALAICRTLLESKQVDENRLGLQSLVTLTDPSKVRDKDADQACRMLLSDASYQGLLEKHFVLEDDATTAAMEGYNHGPFVGSLHLLALKVLSQSLESVAYKQSSSPLAIDLSTVFWRTVLQALYSNLQLASRRPLEASVSIRCLSFLQTLEPSTLRVLVPSPSRLHECLSRAHQYGRDHSRSLEQETEQLMGRLETFVH